MLSSLRRRLRLIVGFGATLAPRLAGVAAAATVVSAKDGSDLVRQSGLVLIVREQTQVFVPVDQLTAADALVKLPPPPQVDWAGSLVLYGNTETPLSGTDLAFISCDDPSFNATAVFLGALDQSPSFVVLYSTVHDFCDYSGKETQRYHNIFTTIDRAKARAVESIAVEKRTGLLKAEVQYNPTLAGTNSNVESSRQNSDVLGPSPSTSVALIILYSITGVITALFLLIIITGAVRAHRHPDRYGPRATARFGRPRQSRAKGIARAVLDTLPIVRFGNTDSTMKPTDVERTGTPDCEQRERTEGDGEAGARQEEHELQPVSASTPATDMAAERKSSEPQEPVPANPTAADGAAPAPPPPATNPDPSQLQCPVCLDDFEQGQDLRMLPCRHSFHPDCIDPWLLNVTGSCPLCRIDLRPEDQRSSFELPPPPPEDHHHHHHHRFMRYLDMARGSTGEERMAALRQLREEENSTGSRQRGRAPELGISRLRSVLSRHKHSGRSSPSVAEESNPSSSAVQLPSADTTRPGLTTIQSQEGTATNTDTSTGAASDQQRTQPAENATR